MKTQNVVMGIGAGAIVVKQELERIADAFNAIAPVAEDLPVNVVEQLGVIADAVAKARLVTTMVPADPTRRHPGIGPLIEDLANIEHQRWSDWQAYLHSLCAYQDPNQVSGIGALVIPIEKVAHWANLMHTQYYALPEHSKQADRDQVARYLPLLIEFVADWIEHQGQVESELLPIEASSLSGKWRREMSRG